MARGNAFGKYLGITALALLVLLAVISYRWTYTPHGRLDYWAALSHHLLSFDYELALSSGESVQIPLNLAFVASSLLPGEEVAKIKDVAIPAGNWDIPARIYWPKDVSQGVTPPVIVYYHGGGFVTGDIESFDALTRSLANATESIVISVGYRLAPAHPYPAAAEDSYAALLWAADQSRQLGGDSDKLVVAGDSAGGNLAAVTALRARDRHGPTLAGQILYYPATDLSGENGSGSELEAEGYVLNEHSRRLFRQSYVGHVENRAQPYISPLKADDLTGLPPALMVTAGFDPLTASASAYAHRLREAGVPVQVKHYPGMIHGFLSVRLFDQRDDALNRTGAFVESLF